MEQVTKAGRKSCGYRNCGVLPQVLVMRRGHERLVVRLGLAGLVEEHLDQLVGIAVGRVQDSLGGGSAWPNDVGEYLGFRGHRMASSSCQRSRGSGSWTTSCAALAQRALQPLAHADHLAALERPRCRPMATHKKRLIFVHVDQKFRHHIRVYEMSLNRLKNTHSFPHN